MNKLVIVFKRIVGSLVINLSYYFYCTRSRTKFHNLFYVLIKFLLRTISISPFEVIDVKSYHSKNSSSSSVQLTRNREVFTSVATYNLEPLTPLIRTSGSEVYMSCLKDVIIQGNSDFILDDNSKYGINDLAFNLKKNYSNYDGILWRQKENLALLKYKKLDFTRVDTAIKLTGKFSNNYYHVIYEILIKLVFIDDAHIPTNIPYLIDESILKVSTFNELFNILNTSNRKYIKVGKTEVLSIGLLYDISPINQIPPHIRELNAIDVQDFYFDLESLRKMRNLILNKKSNKFFPTKIFITRRGSRNRKYNESEIIDLLKKKGFTTIAPEELNLFDQVSLFNQAEIIVAASGAALSNILFCTKKCKIICLQSRRLNLPIFSTIASMLEIEMRYLEGNPYGFNKNRLHANYRININELETLIESTTS